MRARFFDRLSKGRLAWLLGLLLLMPLAQTAATWHLASHIHAHASQRSDDGSAALADYCDLCRTAVATTGGLLPSQPVVPLAMAAPLQVAQFHPRPAVLQPPWPPYASRAPPLALI